MHRIANQGLLRILAISAAGIGLAAQGASAGGKHKHHQFVTVLPGVAPIAQAPVAYTQVAQTQVAYTQVAQAPVAYTQVAQAPVGYAPTPSLNYGYAPGPGNGSPFGGMGAAPSPPSSLSITSSEASAILSDLRVIYLTSSAGSQLEKIRDVREEATTMIRDTREPGATDSDELSSEQRRYIDTLVEATVNQSGFAPGAMQGQGPLMNSGQAPSGHSYYQYVLPQVTYAPAPSYAPAPALAPSGIPPGFTFIPLVPKHSLFHKNVYKIP